MNGEQVSTLLVSWISESAEQTDLEERPGAGGGID